MTVITACQHTPNSAMGRERRYLIDKEEAARNLAASYTCDVILQSTVNTLVLGYGSGP